MKAFYYLLFVLLLLFSVCKKEKPVTQELLQGVWESYLDPNKIYFAGSYYTLHFIEDSLQIEWNYFTDILIVNDPCYPKKYKNFIAGKYSINKLNLEVDAQYVDSSFSALNIDTCRKMGAIMSVGEIKSIKDTLFIDLPFSINSDFSFKTKFLRK